MFGKGEPVDLQVRSLEADIVRARFDQVAWQHQLEEFVSAEVRGLALVDSARAGQTLARRHIEENAQAISSLQDEISALIPPPRPPA